MYLTWARWRCSTCGASGEGKNAMGVAAKHHKKYEHSVIVDLDYTHVFWNKKDKEKKSDEQGTLFSEKTS